MGSDDLFKKRRENRKKRQHEIKNPKANSYLIVTEGQRTEPLYFRGIADEIQNKIGGNVEIREVPLIDIDGAGCATNKLIAKTDQIISEAKIIYQNVWLVFDKVNDIFKEYNLGDGVYCKNYSEIYHLVNTFDGVNTAIRNAKRRMSGYNSKGDKPSEYDPGTMVFQLMEKLVGYLKE